MADAGKGGGEPSRSNASTKRKATDDAGDEDAQSAPKELLSVPDFSLDDDLSEPADQPGDSQAGEAQAFLITPRNWRGVCSAYGMDLLYASALIRERMPALLVAILRVVWDSSPELSDGKPFPTDITLLVTIGEIPSDCGIILSTSVQQFLSRFRNGAPLSLPLTDDPTGPAVELQSRPMLPGAAEYEGGAEEGDAAAPHGARGSSGCWRAGQRWRRCALRCACAANTHTRGQYWEGTARDNEQTNLKRTNETPRV